MWDVSREAFWKPPGPRGCSISPGASPPQLPVIAPGRTLRWLARTTLTDPRLRTVLERYATYAGSDPRFAPAALAATAFIEQEYGCWYVEGGLHQIATALAARIPEICTGAAVTGIATAGGRVSGVHLEGRPAAGRRRRRLRRRRDTPLRRTAPAAPARAARRAVARPDSSCCWDYATRRRISPHHTVLFPSLSGFGYAAEFDLIFGGRLSSQPDRVRQCARRSVDRAGGRPGGVRVGQRPAPRAVRLGRSRRPPSSTRVTSWTSWQRAGWTCGSACCSARPARPADLQRDTGAPGGAIYGASSHGTLAAFRRAANRSPVPGLFLTGGSAHPGGGLPLVALSAAAVARLIGPA